ncbi:PREDICTED: mitochondrial cardiolipin hydrolase-like [Amphimedon queenslandica]|uniref:Mitochondrial cardiolipin hydrolase n=1 Tax=Amphimedon queenslandica TaxID=400682 RepID=A0A1X7VTZ3_AMPQE|nr:PREDICTED: mitochondrial cardiolipin hydrolase-like [Amphimedon queenslandica]|eukprot:XP_003382843.1 PREDICTED: mitochondrial cardiolipin hydrolase-like [Amphimedon queenslandica]
MAGTPPTRSLLFFFSLVCFGTLSVILLLKTKNKRKKKRIVTPKHLFFPDKSGHNASTLLNLISSLPSHSLDICVYCLNGKDFLEAILSVHKRGVPVRVITDNEESYVQIATLRKGGVQVRTNMSSSYLMHHKFAIIDRSLLITGSLNWTRQGLNGNYENVIITDDVGYLGGFLKQFEELWESFDPLASK